MDVLSRFCRRLAPLLFRFSFAVQNDPFVFHIPRFNKVTGWKFKWCITLELFLEVESRQRGHRKIMYGDKGVLNISNSCFRGLDCLA